MSPAEKKIIISDAAGLDAGTLRGVIRAVERTFDYPTETTALLHDFSFAYDINRGQYHSTLVLEKLTALAPRRALKVLAFTDVDLFIPILTHVFGEAQLGGVSCIVSTYRLDVDLSAADGRRLFQTRVAKEAVHELGHTFSLRHCRDKSCIMHYCRSILDVDAKSNRLCRYCRVLLADAKKRLPS